MGSRSTTWSQTFSHYIRSSKAQPPPPVYSRDFAYANNAPVVLAHPMRAERASISGTSAKAFAELGETSAWMAHSSFLGTPNRSHLWWSSAHNCHGMDEAKALHKRLLSGPTVDIYVGPERKHWSLHRNLLCHHSSYFETEFQGHEVPKGAGKKHGPGDNTLELPDDDPRGFELLVKWLYQGQLEDMAQDTDEQKYEYAVGCHKLYMLCDKFDMITLKNQAVDQYRRGLNEAQLVPDADEINEIYRASPVGSPFRKLMIKIAARQIMDPEVEKDAGSYRQCFEENSEFAVEMVNAIRYMSDGMLFDDPTASEECEYHDHRDSSQCKGKAPLKPKPGVTENGHLPGPSSPTTTREQTPAELSAVKRTPRKLDIRQPPGSPTPKAQPRRFPPGIMNGHYNAPKVNGMSKHSAANTADERQELADPAKQGSAQTNGGATGNHTPSLAAEERKHPPVASTVLGKRRGGGNNSAVDGNPSHPLRPAAPTRKQSNVNGIVQHLNGVSSVNGGVNGVTSSEESRQSRGGASQEVRAGEVPGFRKVGAPKLRKASVNGEYR